MAEDLHLLSLTDSFKKIQNDYESFLQKEAKLYADYRTFDEDFKDTRLHIEKLETEELDVKNVLKATDKIYEDFMEAKKKFLSEQEKLRAKNSEEKTKILAQLRTLVESEDAISSADAFKKSFEQFKKIEKNWKDLGNIPSPDNNILWKTYHSLVTSFYDNRKIYFELLDLDRAKNLIAKEELCKRIESLGKEVEGKTEIPGRIVGEAENIFEQYKHIGPAPKEVNEILWNRFKNALDSIYVERKNYIKLRKEAEHEIIAQIKDLADVSATLATFSSDTITEWIKKTEVATALKGRWEAVKGAHFQEARELSKQFWTNIKAFYQNKSAFFKVIDAQREENLQKKITLCEQVEEILNKSDNLEKGKNQIIKFQTDWKAISRVPEKNSEQVYKRFKDACDAFFERLRTHSSHEKQELDQNLVQKKALLDEMSQKLNDKPTPEELKIFKERWSAIGFVPFKISKEINEQYRKIVSDYITSFGKNLSSKDKFNLSSDDGAFKGMRESDIRKKINQLESEAMVWKNNIEFFSKNKTADKLRKTFETRIEQSELTIQQLRNQLKLIAESR